MVDRDDHRFAQEEVVVQGEAVQEEGFLRGFPQRVDKHGGDQAGLPGVDLVASLVDGLGEPPVVTGPGDQAGVDAGEGLGDGPELRFPGAQGGCVDELDDPFSLVVPGIVPGHLLVREGQELVVPVQGERVARMEAAGLFHELVQPLQAEVHGFHAVQLVLPPDGEGAGDHGLVRMGIHVRLGPEARPGRQAGGRHVPLLVMVARPLGVVVLVVESQAAFLVAAPEEAGAFAVGPEGVRFRPHAPARHEGGAALVGHDAGQHRSIEGLVRPPVGAQVGHGAAERLAAGDLGPEVRDDAGTGLVH